MNAIVTLIRKTFHTLSGGQAAGDRVVRGITLIRVVLFLALASAAQADSTVNLVLHLHDTQGHSYTYRTEVEGSRYSDGSTPTPTELRDHLKAAMEKMADELGYTAALHGPDHYKVLGAVRVVGAWLETSGRRETLSWFHGGEDRAD